MAEIADWFNHIPPITKHWFAASVALPLLCRFTTIKPYYMILTSDFLKSLALWKPVTSVFYYPVGMGKGFDYLTNLYFLYSYSQRLELGFFNGRKAEHVFMLLFLWLSSVVISLALGVYLLMDPMVMSVIYVFCMINQDQVVSFWFGTRFKARYLPWALFLMKFVLGEGGLGELVGILVGHLYYFVMMKYPADQGVTLVRVPQILYTLLPSSQGAAPYRAPSPRPNRPASTLGAAPTAPTGYNWGRGRRLED